MPQSHRQIERGAVATVVVVAVENQHLRRNAQGFGQTFLPSVASSPATMHSFSPVPRIIASYLPSARAGYSVPRIVTGGMGSIVELK